MNLSINTLMPCIHRQHVGGEDVAKFVVVEFIVAGAQSQVSDSWLARPQAATPSTLINTKYHPRIYNRKINNN